MIRRKDTVLFVFVINVIEHYNSILTLIILTASFNSSGEKLFTSKVNVTVFHWPKTGLILFKPHCTETNYKKMF